MCPSWCCDDDIDAAFECDELRSDGLAAIDGEYGNSLLFPIAMDGLGHLYCQFPCWHENEGERVLLPYRMGQALEKGEGERGCLTCSCRGVSQKVTSGQ